jgi:hypothetical protein
LQNEFDQKRCPANGHINDIENFAKLCRAIGDR